MPTATVTDVQLFLSVLLIILSITPLYLKLGQLEGQLDMLHEKVVALCKKIDKKEEKEN